MYDTIIIGGGPAGMSAAIYAARFDLKTLLIAKEKGGTICEAHVVENYPAIKSISGIDLMKKMQEQAESLGAEIKAEEVKGIRKDKKRFAINSKYRAKSIILALGTKRRHLNIPGEAEFAGKGVSYCAVCDAPFYKNKIVGVVGGSNAAARAAQILSEFAKKVYIIYRKEKLRAEPRLVDEINEVKNIEIINNTNITEIKGDKFVNSVVFHSGEVFMLDGIFIEAGSIPSTILAKELKVKVDKEDYIAVDDAMRTSQKHIYAAGDVTTGSNKWKQVITACAEGALAAASAYEDLK